MSEPRIIPADKARELREAATPGPWEAVLQERIAGPVYAHHVGPLTAGVNDFEDAVIEFEYDGDIDLIIAAPSLAFTVEQQAAQIARLQAAVHHALYYSAENVGDIIEHGILTEGDMQ